MNIAKELRVLKEVNNLAFTSNDKYELSVTSWLGPNACWQGPRIDIWSFRSVTEANRAKEIILKMLRKQKRIGEQVEIGDDEREWLKDYGGENFFILWSVGDITRVTRCKMTN